MSSEIYQKNLESFKLSNPALFYQICNAKMNGEDDQVMLAKSGSPTIRVKQPNGYSYLHSKYDPKKEAERFIEEALDPNYDEYLVYGFGLAYHIKELLMKGQCKKLYIIETNIQIMIAALHVLDLREVFISERVEIYVAMSPGEFGNQLKKLLRNKNRKLIIHLPSLTVMKKEFKEYQYLLEEFRISMNSIEKFNNDLHDNFTENIENYHCNVDVLFDKFTNCPLFLVAAGPSLDRNKHLLKNVKNKGIILAVSRAVKSLLAVGVEPDLIIVTDPLTVVFEHLKGLNLSIPLIAISTCSKNIMKHYKGLKLIAYQKGFKPAETLAQKTNRRLINTGGSVATAALDIAIKMQCDPIVFVGQDLAFSDMKTHSITANHRVLATTSGLRTVIGNNGKELYTNPALYSFLRWIENRIKVEKNKTFLNATEGGARIKGTKSITLLEVIDAMKPLDINFSSVFNTIIKEHNYEG